MVRSAIAKLLLQQHTRAVELLEYIRGTGSHPVRAYAANLGDRATLFCAVARRIDFR